MRYDVTIVGGGVVGCAIAHRLSGTRASVRLVEARAEVGFGTSKANSGIIHSGHRWPPGTLKGELGWRGNRRWGDLAAELGFGFRVTGDLTCAFDEADVGVLEEMQAWGAERGIPGLEMWDSARIRREEPNLSTRVIAALHAPDTAVVNPYEACFALIDDARRNGVEVSTGEPVESIAAGDGGFEVTTAHHRFETRLLVNAAGVDADRVAALAGAGAFTLRARKGEEYLLDKRLEGIVRRVIYPCPTETSKGILVIPTFDGTVMVGPTAELVDDRYDLTTTTGGAEDVFSSAARLVPRIRSEDCIAEFAGIRAVAPDEDFIVAPASIPGLVNVAGIQSPGLTAAPAIAEMVVDLLAGQGLETGPTATRAHPTRPVRVAALSEADQVELADRDPRYGHVVCRCELVTEGEIVDAIDAGSRTLDGLKFRTRAGMGRCQGGFCTWRCMQLLSDRLGVPVPTITKRGEGSWLVCDRLESGS
jgi:glycerol-3-phosphate dehydrogenase